MTEFEKWIHDDITFCMTACDNEKCFRHPSNILTDGPHSFSEFGDTKLCPLYKEKKMRKYIDADELICRINDGTLGEVFPMEKVKRISRYIDAVQFWKRITSKCEEFVDLETIEEILDDMPTADVVEVRHGHWKIIKYPTGVEAFGNKEMTVQSLMCSNCSYEIDVSEGYFEYCPNCGSFMDWEYEEW